MVKAEPIEREYSPTTYGGSSDEEGVVKVKIPSEVKMRIKCLKVSRKAIKKDKKLADFINAEQKRLMSSTETLNKNDRKEDLIVRLMQADANETENINLSTVQEIAIKLEASK